jgi:hypothetical protein
MHETSQDAAAAILTEQGRWSLTGSPFWLSLPSAPSVALNLLEISLLSSQHLEQPHLAHIWCSLTQFTPGIPLSNPLILKQQELKTGMIV